MIFLNQINYLYKDLKRFLNSVGGECNVFVIVKKDRMRMNGIVYWKKVVQNQSFKGKEELNI